MVHSGPGEKGFSLECDFYWEKLGGGEGESGAAVIYKHILCFQNYTGGNVQPLAFPTLLAEQP